MENLLETLFHRHHRDVYLYLYSLSHDWETAEELTAETFLEVVQALPRFRGDSDVKTWLFAIARHRWTHWLRRQKREPTAVLLDDLLESHGPTPEEQLCTKAAADRVRTLLAQEPERTSTIVTLRLSGLSFHEIGEAVGISENSARVIDFRTRTKLRKQLKKEGFTDE